MLTEPLAITAMGMATSLGSARTACAAARAGLSRPRPLGFEVEDAASLAMVPVHGHRVGALTAGFGEVGLMVRLGALALADLVESMSLTAEAPQRLAVAVNLPSGFYFQQVDALRARLAAEAGREPALPSVDEPASLHEGFAQTQVLYQEGLIDKMFRAVDVAAPPPSLRAVCFGDQPGVAQALLAAQRWLGEGQADACIVLGIDSLVEPRWLQVLAELGILHTPLYPAGLVPSEAAAAVLLERRPGSRVRRTLGVVSGFALEREAGNRFSERPAVGRALGRAVRRCIQQAARVDVALRTPHRSATLVADLNGDPVRAADFGAALVGLTRELEPAATLFPALQFGDTRAASGFLGACIALCAFERGYAQSSSYVLCAAGDDGGRAAVAISSPARADEVME